MVPCHYGIIWYGVYSKLTVKKMEGVSQAGSLRFFF